jgi:hypothetical protein
LTVVVVAVAAVVAVVVIVILIKVKLKLVKVEAEVDQKKRKLIIEFLILNFIFVNILIFMFINHIGTYEYFNRYRVFNLHIKMIPQVPLDVLNVKYLYLINYRVTVFFETIRNHLFTSEMY